MPKNNYQPEGEETIILCTVAEVNTHLRAFITAFILDQTQSRWIEFLIDKRGEWDITPRSPRSIKVLHKAQDVLRMFRADERYCIPIPNAQRTPAYYTAFFSNASGVYFALGTPPCKLTAAQADEKFSWENESAMLSFEAGKKALFFCHDGRVWKCERD